jgi:light-regulated signal transduction histidine kinase (bacteriophytochrome)
VGPGVLAGAIEDAFMLGPLYLAICRPYVEGMGRRIWVDSRGVPGKGMTFIFTLPAARSTPVRIGASAGRAE